MNHENCCIITYLDSNYEKNLLEDFLPTLRNEAQYKGMVVVIDFGISEEAKIKAERDFDCVIYTTEKTRSVESGRNEAILYVLSIINDDKKVMTIDAGDVWFQQPFDEIFDICKDDIGFVEEKEWCDQGWMGAIIEQIKNPDLRKIVQSDLKGKLLKGAGMICGPKDKMVLQFEKTIEYINQLDDDRFGVDQIAFNLACKEGISLPKTYDFVCIPRLNEFTVNTDMQVEYEGEVVKVVHCAGGQHRLFKSRADMIQQVKARQ